MSSVAFSSTIPPNVAQIDATARTGPAQNQTVGQAAPDPPEDTVKLSDSAQAEAMYQSGQSVSSIASSLGTTVDTVDSYLDITATAVSPQAAISHMGASAPKSAPAAATAPAASTTPAASAAPATSAKVDVKA